MNLYELTQLYNILSDIINYHGKYPHKWKNMLNFAKLNNKDQLL